VRKMQKFSIVALSICLLTGGNQVRGANAPSAPAGEPSASLVQKLVQEALKANPDLKAAQNRWHLNERKVIPAQSLPDPQLSFDFSNYPIDSLAGNQTPMTGNDLKLSQKFPFPGKLASQGEMARQQAEWYQQAYRDQRLQLAAKVKDAYYRLYFREKAIDVTQKNIDVMDDFIRLTETKYEVGQGLQQDVLKAQVERSKLMDNLLTLKQQRETALADLNTLLARPAVTPLGPLPEVRMTPVEVSAAELQQQSEQQRPLYAAYQALVTRFKAQKKLAKLDYWPDFNVWAGYRFRQNSPGDPVHGTDFISAGVTINLPIFREKRREAIAEADTGIHMALDRYADFRNKVYFGIQDSYAQMAKNRRLTELYQKGIIPQAEQSYESALAGYQVGKVDFLTLLDNLLTLFRYRIDYYQVLTDYQRNVARLEAASGVRLGASSASSRSAAD
jgi:cobalt-zinc-cadmium efflux system outer membrane protein